MTSADRRQAILDAAAPLFARQGLPGTTTRQIADAAGVSEALLYKHFANKAAIYEALGKQPPATDPAADALPALLAQPPSTAQLVRLVDYLIAQPAPDPDQVQTRLTARSLLGDGAYARDQLDDLRIVLGPAFLDALRAAQKAGDLRKSANADELALWFVHHLGYACRLFRLPVPPAFAPDQTEARVNREALLFALRGLGLRNSAIRKHAP